MNLIQFQKPSRYIGNEVNIIPMRRDAQVKIALCFPDAYEIGMSHLGLKILYSIINRIPYASAERAFAPWIDYEGFLRQKGLPLTSLESKRPLKDFDIVGFSLQYELSYTNVLNMLDLGGIPVRAEDRFGTNLRGDNYPLVIAGGPCTINPMPLIPFIDAFIIGDGEEVIREIIDVYKSFKMQNEKCKMKNERLKIKENLLNALSKLEGVYVPSIHSNRQRIKKRIIENLDDALFPDAPLVPFTSIVHDRIAIEISRGCTRGCRFCQAGIIYRPLRERSLEKVLSLAQKSILNTGYSEVSFTSLSTGDYSYLLPLIRAFQKRFPGIAISLPSLRVGSVSCEILDEMKSLRKTGFTIAPEAGSKRLRSIINKDFSEEEYEESMKRLFSAGWKKVKLYFMIGLPTETEKDIEGIIKMVEDSRRKGRKLTGSSVNINVGISAFIPKPHTPFQWLGQMPFEELRKRQDYLRKTLCRKGFNFKGQHVEVSLIEAVLSRGDRSMSSLIESAWRFGSRFDGWSETFDFDIWQRAGDITGIDLKGYASRKIDIEEELPWEIIGTGVTKEFLIGEFHNAFKGETTEDCRFICHNCGLECKGSNKLQVASCRTNSPLPPLTKGGTGGITISEIPASPARFAESRRAGRRNPKSEINNSSLNVRVNFSKGGILRYLSHLELMNTLLRAMRRAGIPLVYTKGFHPRPKVSFGHALPVGVEGLNEYFDMEIYNSMDVSEIPERINATLPGGLRVIGTSVITNKDKGINNYFFKYKYEITSGKLMAESNTSLFEDLFSNIDRFMQSSQYLISRDDRMVDIRQMVEKAEIDNGTIQLILKDTDKTKMRLYEILKEIFCLSMNELYELEIKRTKLSD